MSYIPRQFDPPSICKGIMKAAPCTYYISEHHLPAITQIREIICIITGKMRKVTVLQFAFLISVRRNCKRRSSTLHKAYTYLCSIGQSLVNCDHCIIIKKIHIISRATGIYMLSVLLGTALHISADESVAGNTEYCTFRRNIIIKNIYTTAITRPPRKVIPCNFPSADIEFRITTH